MSRYLRHLVLGIMLTSCGTWIGNPKPKDDDSGTKALADNPAEAFNLLDTSVKSATPEKSAILVQPSQAANLVADNTGSCSTSALPISKESGRNTAVDGKSQEAVLPRTDPDYAAGRFYCLLKKDTGDAESVQGAYREALSHACFMGDQIVYDGTPHEYVIDVATSLCIQEHRKAEMAKEGITTVHMTVLASKPAAFGGGGWDASYQVTLKPKPEQSIGFKMLLHADAKEVAAAVLGGGNPDDAFTFTLNPNEGTLRFEAKFQRLSQEGWSHHVRLLVRGAMESNGAFTDVTSLEGLQGTLNSQQAGSGNAVNNGTLLTIKGDFVTGLRSQSYSCNSATADGCSAMSISLWPTLVSGGVCHAEGATPCQNNNGIEVLADNDLDFVMNPNDSTRFLTVEQWINQLTPLLFHELSTAQTQ